MGNWERFLLSDNMAQIITFLDKFIIISLVFLNSANLAVGGWFSEVEEHEATETLANFKVMVDEIVHEPFMKDDGYLLRLLKVYDFDLDLAFLMLKKTVEWRKSDNISGLIYEKCTPLITKEYPMLLDGNEDKDGRPILVLPMGKYDLRKGFLAGQKDAMGRCMIRAFELMERSIYMKRKSGNKKVTQAVAILDIEGFNLVQSGCWNLPKIFDTMLNLIKSFLEKSTKESIRVYDSNSEIWKADLLKEITSENLQVTFDGLRFKNRTNFEEKLAEFFRAEADKETSTTVDSIPDADVEGHLRTEQHIRHDHLHQHHRHYTVNASTQASSSFSPFFDNTPLNKISNEKDKSSQKIDLGIQNVNEFTPVKNNVDIESSKPLSWRKSKARDKGFSNLNHNDTVSPGSSSSGSIFATQTTILWSLQIVLSILISHIYLYF